MQYVKESSNVFALVFLLHMYFLNFTDLVTSNLNLNVKRKIDGYDLYYFCYAYVKYYDILSLLIVIKSL